MQDEITHSMPNYYRDDEEVPIKKSKKQKPINHIEFNRNFMSYIQIALNDVRAADNIRITYDFDRDGWKIEQASIFERESNETNYEPDWQEVAFIQAWGRTKK